MTNLNPVGIGVVASVTVVCGACIATAAWRFTRHGRKDAGAIVALVVALICAAVLTSFGVIAALPPSVPDMLQLLRLDTSDMTTSLEAIGYTGDSAIIYARVTPEQLAELQALSPAGALDSSAYAAFQVEEAWETLEARDYGKVVVRFVKAGDDGGNYFAFVTVQDGALRYDMYTELASQQLSPDRVVNAGYLVDSVSADSEAVSLIASWQ